jgi:hypothetical protein
MTLVPPPHEQRNPLHYLIPGGNNFPHALEANWRNLHAHEFLVALSQEQMRYPTRAPLHAMGLRRALQRTSTTILSSQLNGDHYDFQGLAWTFMGIPRKEARRRRFDTYENHVNMRGADHIKDPGDTFLPAYQNFFRFKRADILDDTRIPHFQLRNLLACPDRSHAFYTASGGIRCMNLLTGSITPALKVPAPGSFCCIAVDYGVVIGGTLNGSYSIRMLDSKIGDASEGLITRALGGVTNHFDMHTSRGSDSPRVGICSNDNHFRVMDLQTQAMISTWTCDGPYNCSSVSKDGRLRAMVGDFSPVVICDAASGTVVQALKGHRDYGFACAWADDGWTLATGNQDRKLCIWDARKWCDSNGHSRPVTTIRSEMAGVRSLNFSPLGSGKPVLVAAEEADFVNIIDAQTYKSKQTIDLFGNIGGVAFTNEGRNINVFCCDPHRGSLMQFERCGQEVEPLLELENIDLSGTRDPRPVSQRETPYSDLVQDYIDAF